jgi:hypothetical protein
MQEGIMVLVQADEEVVGASHNRRLVMRARDPRRWPGRKSMEAEFFTEALGTAKPKNIPCG